MGHAILFVQILAGLASFAASALLICFPRKAIQIQIAFYRRINWILEPVSMETEIRNTRWMGAALLFCAVTFLVYTVASIQNSFLGLKNETVLNRSIVL